MPYLYGNQYTLCLLSVYISLFSPPMSSIYLSLSVLTPALLCAIKYYCLSKILTPSVTVWSEIFAQFSVIYLNMSVSQTSSPDTHE